MNRAAAYLRRSTEEHQAESLTVQLESATRFAATLGVTEPLRVFSDDAISRSEFKKRPGLIALLNAAQNHELDLVICRDADRLGGDVFRAGLATCDLLDSGCRLYYYASGLEQTLDGGAVDKFMLSARSFASELEREKATSRTREHLEQKARKGLVVGGKVYGYQNLETQKSDAGRVVEYRVDPGEAKTVVRIFTLFVGGEGVRGIAHILNAEGIPSPRAGKRGTGSWSPSAIWAMLRSERYKGTLIWGRKGRAYKFGTRTQFSRGVEGQIRIERPELRIVSEELWAGVRARIAQNQRFRGPHPYARAGAKRRFLLTGLSRCAKCGGPICATTGRAGARRIMTYTCMWRRDRGSCKSSLHRDVEVIDAAVIGWIEKYALNEGIIESIFAELRRLVTAGQKTSTSDVPKLEKEERQLKVEVGRLANALASTDQKPEAVIAAIAEREAKMAQLRGRIEAMKAAPTVLTTEMARLEKTARTRLKDLRGLLTKNPEEARRVLEALLQGPLKLLPVETPEGMRFEIEGNVSVGTLLTQEAGADPVTLRQQVTPTGFEPMYPA